MNMFELVLLAELYKSIMDQYDHNKTEEQVNDIIKVCIGVSMAHLQNKISPAHLMISKDKLAKTISPGVMEKHDLILDKILFSTSRLQDLYNDIEFEYLMKGDLGIDSGPAADPV